MDDFYVIPEEKINHIIRESHSLANKVSFERKNDSYTREKCDITFEELMDIFSKAPMHWVFIKRKEYFYSIKEVNIFYEIGGCTMYGPNDYFMFLYLDEDKGNELVKKYNLKIL